MKLPRRQAKCAPETAEPASASPGAPVLQVLIFSNTDLPEQEFNAQRGKIRRVANYDSHTRSWHNQIPLNRPEWAAEMLSTLFEAARVHGTTIQVQAQPIVSSLDQGSLSNNLGSHRPTRIDNRIMTLESTDRSSPPRREPTVASLRSGQSR